VFLCRGFSCQNSVFDDLDFVLGCHGFDSCDLLNLAFDEAVTGERYCSISYICVHIGLVKEYRVEKLFILAREWVLVVEGGEVQSISKLRVVAFSSSLYDWSSC
jgi:hypothetical protein